MSTVAPLAGTTAAAEAGRGPEPSDPRIAAFCSPSGPEVFQAVSQRSEIWRDDPFDVETIHDEARTTFQRLVERATLPPGPNSGKILLLLGESGCGKTHLMRAFRSWAHARGRAYCGYMQMTTATDRYGRYVLNNMIDSLDRPYYEPHGETSGLVRLSTAMVESVPRILPDRLSRLREGDSSPAELADLVDELAELLVLDDRFGSLDFDLLRALLYLQRDDARLRSRILKYLRCEGLAPVDRMRLGNLEPRTYDGAPESLLEKLGGLMLAVESAALVLCVDQLEDIFDLDDAPGKFRRAAATLCALAGCVPSAIVVVACLENFYDKIKEHLAPAVVFRLQNNPAPIYLKGNRSADEIVEIIARRLDFLYASAGVETAADEPTFPIPAAELMRLSGQWTRQVIGYCHDYRERCIRAGRILPISETAVAEPETSEVTGDDVAVLSIAQEWNDFRSTGSHEVPDSDDSQMELLVWGIRSCSDEVGPSRWFSVEPRGLLAYVECHGSDGALDRLVVGLCNRSARGGGLGNQIAGLCERANDAAASINPVVVRSSDYPSSPAAQVTKQLGELISRGGRRVVVEDSDWRTILALRQFRDAHASDSAFDRWLREERPLGQLKPLRTILDLDQRTTPPPAPVVPRPTLPLFQQEHGPVVVPSSAGDEPQNEAGRLILGWGQDRAGLPVELDPQELTRHAAFLGGSGSGKTTSALNVIEQLLLLGVPALLVDRKGDLCGYADPDASPDSDADPSLRARARRLGERIDVALYTPGNPSGRPLSIAVAPEGLGRLPTFEREQVARYAAMGLGGMMGYSQKGSDQSRLAILAKAIRLLGELGHDAPVTMEGIIAFVHEQDTRLVAAVGLLEPRLFARLVQDLETLRLTRGTLLAAQGERLEPEALLGLGPHAIPGRTRLSVVSTKFLGSNADVQFWVAQLLVELARWASRSPSDRLQAVVLIDEADLYLPALRQPPTKEPMENLLKRARSAGLGLLLATQSPGDLDYKCRDNIRTWVVGRVKEPTALAKMRPMLSECRVDIESRIPTQSPGHFHVLRDGSVVGIRADRNVVPAVQLPEDRILVLAQRTLGQ